VFYSVALGLRKGVNPRPMFERRARPIYMLIALTAAVAVALLIVGGYRIAPEYMWSSWSVPVLLLAAFCARHVGHSTLAGILEAGTLLTCEALLIYLLLIPLVAMSGAPYADRTLATVDKALGFDWVSYAQFVEPYMPVLLKAYRSFQWQPSLVIILLFWLRQDARAWRFVAAATVALATTAVIFPLVPAKGAFVYYGIGEYAGFKSRQPWQFAETLEHIRSGSRLIDSGMFGGIVSFPSFHTAMAALLTWAAWPTWVRWPTAALNLLMVAAAIVCGSHYLVDLLGGAAIAAASILIVSHLEVGCDNDLPAAPSATRTKGAAG
jgi:membrane-associated phospholipid phosphatase